MKALTISQPFASLIVSGAKFIENRGWPTNYRGELAIHAGKGTQYLDKSELLAYPTSCVVAVSKLAACVSLELIRTKAHSAERGIKIPGTSRTWVEACEHPHAEGPWCWILEDIRAVFHVPMRGKQGLWACGQIPVKDVADDKG
jgi:activating signal cointegrator 1